MSSLSGKTLSSAPCSCGARSLREAFFVSMRLNEPETQSPLVPRTSASELGLPPPVAPVLSALVPTKTDTLWPEVVIARGGGSLALLRDDGDALALPPLPTYTETRDLLGAGG